MSKQQGSIVEVQQHEDETTPLLVVVVGGKPKKKTQSSSRRRQRLYAFLEAKTYWGQIYEYFIMILIWLNVICFILGSLFNEEYNPEPEWAQREGGICGNLCDAIWFGNYVDNGLQVLNIGKTSFLELITVAVFTVEYIARLITGDMEDDKYKGFLGRLRFIPTFFSVVDLASTLPFYIDAFILRHTDIAASTFLRMFRMLRFMCVEGRYDTAISIVNDVWMAQKSILGAALYVGITTWMVVASLYYLVERKSLDMIYCGAAPDYCGDSDSIDTSLCSIDKYRFVDCSDAGCPPSENYPQPCYNLYQSIPLASYFTLLNLFGEFPLVDQHSVGGMVVGTFTAVVAVAVFALPSGIIGNGFEDQVAQRTQQKSDDDQGRDGDVDVGVGPIVERGLKTDGFEANSQTIRGRLYNFLHAQITPGSVAFEYFINFLVIGTTLTFMLDTLHDIPQKWRTFQASFEFFAVCVFTVEYISKLYSSLEDPKFANRGLGGLLSYATHFLPVVDLLSVVPYWLEVAFWTGSPFGSTSSGNLVKVLRLFRIMRFDKYTHAFTSFHDVISRNWDVLAVTAFTAILFWIFFGVFLYFTERDNPDEEMASNYNTVPNSMWVTLLNLSGESPLCQYSIWGKVVTGILGLFATGVFGIPIGIIGAGFQQVLVEENEDNTEELEQRPSLSSVEGLLGNSVEQTCYKFVNGIDSYAGKIFESFIYLLIFIVVGIGVIQTVEGHEDDFDQVETMAVIVFTVEYLIRLLGVGADPEFASNRNGIALLHFFFSFYSIVDLLAIVPFYLAVALPGSIIDEYDEYLRMCRILRLVKLDKYVPSITLIDDVIRLKYNTLRVAFYAAMTLWILFAAWMYLFEVNDDDNELDDPVPKYGCVEDCTMADRFQNVFDSLVYTGVHLTGDYPIITYSWPARFVNFFLVIAAVGVVSVPSAVLASGFVEIIQSKAKARRARSAGGPPPPSGGVAGDDWYEYAYRELEGIDPPPSRFGPRVDRWQFAVDKFLNGVKDESGHTQHTSWSFAYRVFIFALIIANVAAVLLESVPFIDKMVGNDPGNFFDVFEACSVFIFTAEYVSRLFCAPKNREALYSTFVYATTFFGIVDFISTAPWFVQEALLATGTIHADDDTAMIFRIFRIFRILQLEDFVTAFSKLDNVFRASKDTLKATGLMALIIWVGSGALFYIVEANNPNWRSCDDSVPLTASGTDVPGCYDFSSTTECNAYYPGLCEQRVFTNMPNTLYLTAVFLGGEWGVIDFTWPGRWPMCLSSSLRGWHWIVRHSYRYVV